MSRPGEGAMLSEQEQREIAAERAHYEQPQAAAIEALKIVQAHRGWPISQQDTESQTWITCRPTGWR